MAEWVVEPGHDYTIEVEYGNTIELGCAGTPGTSMFGVMIVDALALAGGQKGGRTPAVLDSN